MKNYKYFETSNSLKSRIIFNNKFGNFNLFKYIDNKFKIKKNEVILDFGCGDGRYSGLFLKKIKSNGSLFCIDKNSYFIKKLKKKFKKQKNIKVLNLDFDSNWKIDKKLDWFFSIYSIQYTNNFYRLILKIKKLLKINSKLVLIGPGKDNSLEINRLHLIIFNKQAPKLYIDRMGLIEKKFFKILKNIFKKRKITLKRFNYTIKFSNAFQYAKYYWSTPLWMNEVASMNKIELEKKKKKTVLIIKNMRSYVLKKQTIIVFCR